VPPGVERRHRARHNDRVSHSADGTPADPPPLADLIPAWLDWDEAAAELGVSVSRVRRLVTEHQLAAAVPAPGGRQQLPAEQLLDGEIVKGLSGLLTLLHDHGFDDRSALTWLFTADDTLPGRPIDALRENRGAEVKRRAQAMA